MYPGGGILNLYSAIRVVLKFVADILINKEFFKITFINRLFQMSTYIQKDSILKANFAILDPRFKMKEKRLDRS